MNNENNLRTFLRLIAWRIVALWVSREGPKMAMPSINIQRIITLNNTHKGKTMSVQPVELSKAYRLLQVGSTTMISAKYDGVENVMSAAWVGLAGERKVVAYIGPQAFTRQLVEKSGYFVVQIPVVSQMATVLYAGGRRYADAPDKNDSIPFIYQPGFDIPLVAGCAGWLVCKVMPYPDIQQQHNLFMGDIVAAWSDDRVFRNGHWIFDDAPDELRTVHYVAGGQFYAIGKGSKFDHGPGQD
nr:flavin reductase like domain protein [uncultured bacterium]